MTARVLAGSSPTPHASVIFTLTQPDGSQVMKTGKADSTGKAPWNYKLGSGAPMGSYSLIATPRYSSHSTTSDTASLTVQ